MPLQPKPVAFRTSAEWIVEQERPRFASPLGLKGLKTPTSEKMLPGQRSPAACRGCDNIAPETISPKSYSQFRMQFLP
jgi:hypothetical protein